jgi:iron-sulfur cluster repair protein YtfE (RIC family)
MPSLKDELLNGITKTKQQLFPLVEMAKELNESARAAAVSLHVAWNNLEDAAETIKARANDIIPPIQRRF